MSANEDFLSLNLNSTKEPAHPSHEARTEHTGDATEANKSEEERLDRVAMESAKRAENRIHKDEETTPGNTIFSK